MSWDTDVLQVVPVEQEVTSWLVVASKIDSTYGEPVTVGLAVAVRVTEVATTGVVLLAARVAVHWLVQFTDVDAEAWVLGGGIVVEAVAT